MMDNKKVLETLWNCLNVSYDDALAMQDFVLQQFDGFIIFSDYMCPLTFGVEFERFCLELKCDYILHGKLITREVFETVVNKYFGEDVLDVCRKDDVA